VLSEAVVMAAGEGRRLRPLSERFAKPVLPIDGRPVIATLVHELALAGIERVTVVTGHLAEQVEALLAGLAPELRFARQPQAIGSADAVRRGLAAGAAAPLVVTAADTVFTAGDIGLFARTFVEGDAPGAVAVRRRPPPGPGRAAVRVENGRVVRLGDHDPGNPLAGAPLWALATALLPFLDGLPGPPYELATAFQRAIDSGLPVAGIEIGPTRDLTYPVDLVRENFPYLRATP
jgi:NDP-sugar pyrophosphorylase family protein